MYRVVLCLVVCGLLAHALPPLRDIGLENHLAKPFERRPTRTYEAEPVETQGWPTYQDRLEQWGGFGQFISRAIDNLNTWLNGEPEEQESPTAVVAGVRPEPAYEELCNAAGSYGYEARSYSRSAWVSISVVSGYPDVAVLNVRPRLLAYFGGANDRNLTIDVTNPLRLKSPAPTGQWGRGFEEKILIYSMYLPSELHDNPPQPDDTDLFITVEPPSKYFAIKFSGYTFDFKNFQKLSELEDLLNGHKERFARGFYFVNAYNTPDDVISDRLNEVLLAFNPKVKKPNCGGWTVETTGAGDRWQGEYPPRNTPDELPSYKQLCPNSSEYDARRYDRAVWVSTNVDSLSSDIGAWVAYKKLDKYFDQYNDQGLQIKKTIPFRITQAWPKSVFDPVFVTKYTYSYYLPANLYDNIPQPLDSDVYLLDEPAAIRFARNYSGFTYGLLDKQELQSLENLLIKSGEQFLSFESWATNRYYNPSDIAFGDRRNDVTVYMDPLSKFPKCLAEFPPCQHRDKECPSYRVLKSLTGDIERRHISGNRYAMQRTRTCIMNEAYEKSYRPLHNYFRGNNSRNLIIQRVPPVILIHKSTDNPPPGCNFTYNLLFYMPADLHHDPPTPTEDGVELIWLEAKETFVLTFEESTNDLVVGAKVASLRTALDTLGYCYDKDEFAIATYDAPFRPLPHRHEIWITQTECTKQSPELRVEYLVVVNGCNEGTECPSYETVHSYPTFNERIYDRRDWVCKESTSCDVESAFNADITPLQEYYQTLYDVPPKSRPITSFLSLPDFLSSGCEKVITTCMYLPQTGRRTLGTPSTGITLETNLWHTAYVASLEGDPTSSNIYGGMVKLLQGIMDADLLHSSNVFVAWHTLPEEDINGARVEIGALTDTLSYNL